MRLHLRLASSQGLSVLLGGLALSLWLAGPPGATAAEPAMSRQQALQAIEHSTAMQRRFGAARLAEVGQMSDSKRLVARLRDDDAQVRQLAEDALRQIWSRSGDRAIDTLQQRGVAQMASGELSEAVKTFTEVIRRKPGFAEAWNKRATVLFQLGDYEASLKDCAEVLKRNPDHFGVLSGYAQIYIARGEFQRAIDWLERALEVNPNLRDAPEAIELLQQQLDEQLKKTI